LGREREREREPDAARSIFMMSCHALKECVQESLQREIVVKILAWEEQAHWESEERLNRTKPSFADLVLLS